MPDNDNVSAAQRVQFQSSDPHGHAALLLVESLIHGLCEKKTLSAEEAVEIVERAANVQSDQAEAADGAGEPLWRSHAILLSIAASLQIDAGSEPLAPRLVT
jgi:hypothetical protein